ncbi:MAG: glycosyltransferase family 4 protein [Planctomycetes bacterium]|nr:glycosyltransferase family 4 protein [Planctomycetota bacterium]
MRILYFADIRFPLERANGVQTMQTCWALAARGHQVTLVVRPDTAPAPRDPFGFYGLPPRDGFVIVRARVVGTRAARRLMYLVQACARSAGPARADAILTRDLGLADLLTRLPRRLRPPVVYESHGFAPEVGRALPDLISGAPQATRAKQARLARRERRVWRDADGYVTITAGLAAELRATFGDRHPLAVVPDGVRLAPGRRFEPQARRRPPVVGYVGHLYPWKGVDILLRALAHLTDVRGLVVGGLPGEPDLDAMRRLAADLGLGQRVTFTGAVDPPRVGAVLAEADILILPNTETAVSARYTSPLKLFEYLAAGRPIVASDLPALREVLTADNSAVLVAPGDPGALAAGIRRVVDDPALGDRLARRAFALAAEYSWDSRAERLERLLVMVVHLRAAGAGNPPAGGRP